MFVPQAWLYNEINSVMHRAWNVQIQISWQQFRGVNVTHFKLSLYKPVNFQNEKRAL